MHQYTTHDGHNEDNLIWYSGAPYECGYKQWLCSVHDTLSGNHRDKLLFCGGTALEWVEIPGLCQNHVVRLHLWEK